ncbi:MAG: pilus assembly protein TadG-related protein [Anaerolineales bacterium]|jgi:hypothetical protein
MITKRLSENGQALILLVLAISGLLAFAALAIDGAMVYSDRRIAQNAADAASTAGAGSAGATLRFNEVSRDNWTCDPASSDYGPIQEAQIKGEAAALSRANENDFSDGINGAQVTVAASCKNISLAEQYIDVEVEITTPTRPSLIHLFYKGPIVNTVHSVGLVRPPYKEGYLEGNAIVGLCPDCKDTVKVAGSPQTVIKDGSIFVNSEDSGAFDQSGSATISIENGSIDVVGGALFDPDMVDPDPVDYQNIQEPYPPDIPPLPVPDECKEENPVVIDGEKAYPGLWKSNKSFPPDGVTSLVNKAGETNDPLIYCLDVSTSVAFKINSTMSITGQNVFFYVKNGGVDWSAGAIIDLEASGNTKSPYQGLLIYVDPHDYAGNLGNEDVIINGHSDSFVAGTIFAPAADCRINGTGEVGSYHLQAICYTVYLEGNGLLDITYDADEQWPVWYPPSLDLDE